jgi:hypothetical protein
MAKWLALPVGLSLSIGGVMPLVHAPPAIAHTALANRGGEAIAESTMAPGADGTQDVEAGAIETGDILPEVADLTTVEVQPEPTPEPGIEAQPEPGTNLGTNPGPEPETNPGPEPGTNPETEPGTNPETEPGTNPETEPGTNPGTEPGTNPGTEPGTNPGTNPALGTDLPPQAPLDAVGVTAPAERSEVFMQAAYLQQGNELSARLRGGGIYVLSPSVLAGITVDLSTGNAFSDTNQTGLSLSELYLTASPANRPELRLTAGLMDLTSYFDRNSFAKDSLTHFFNPVFQTNPALSAVNVASRPGLLVNWLPVDQVSLTATTFSSRRSLGNFALDSLAGEVGVRLGNAIVRGTYVTSRDDGRGDGFGELATVDRGNGQFGGLSGDRETGFGLNGELFIPGLNLGLFGRYGWYTNETMGASGQTYSLGVNGLDVWMAGDRLGLGYGRQLSNPALRQANGGPRPDVWELFYDAPVLDNLRAGISLQQRNAWTETYLGLRLRYDLVWNPLRMSAP